MRRSLLAELTLGARCALVGSFAFGLRESLLMLQKNAFAFASDYLWMYALTPILFWGILALLLIVPCAMVFHLLGKSGGLWRYGAVLGAAGAASAAIPWAAEVNMSLQQVGSGSARALALLTAVSLLTIVLAAFIAGGAAAWYQSKVERPLRYASIVCLTLGVISVVPLARFILGERRSGASPGEATQAERQQTNVLLISIDTLRADVLGSYGHEGGLTPNLDRLALEGARFSQAFSSSPWTLPAMASLFTGLDASTHGAGRVTEARDPLAKSPLPPALWTVARAFKERGYQTAAIVTNPYLALRYGFGSEFDRYDNLSILAEGFIAVRETTLVRLAAWLLPEWMPGDRSRFVSAAAVDWLERHGRRQRFFLWLHYIDPHAPYDAASDARINSFRGDSLLGGTGGGDFRMAAPDIARLRSGEIRPDAAQKRRVRELYENEVAEVDAGLGEVLRALDRLGLARSTMVIAVADHGEEFWEHGGVEHGRTVYDEVVRIPLLLRWPGQVPPGLAVDALVRITDIAPTVLELLHWQVPPGLDGQSLLALMQGAGDGGRIALIENMHFAEERIGMRTATRKYVRWEIGKEEVYDLGRDPAELVDLAGVEPTVAPLRSTFARLTAGRAAPSVHQSVDPDSATKEALRALGYLK
jgi:arylsulfatase A-like enzyme